MSKTSDKTTKLPSYKTLTRKHRGLTQSYEHDTEQLRQVVNGATQTINQLHEENRSLKSQLASSKIDIECSRFALENMTTTLKEFMLKARLPKDRAIGTQGLNHNPAEMSNVQANRN